ncbi:hypothetical protein B0H21DRAFT_723977 [Amylocystis lapponica]|nr:hypothetical protein B0H21DRAFT_723977 [Amylocystis lapponica]
MRIPSLVALPGLLLPIPHSFYTFAARHSPSQLQAQVQHGVKLYAQLVVSGNLRANVYSSYWYLCSAVALYSRFVYTEFTAVLRGYLRHGLALYPGLLPSRLLGSFLLKVPEIPWLYITGNIALLLFIYFLFSGFSIYITRCSSVWTVAINIDLVIITFYIVHNAIEAIPILLRGGYPYVWSPAPGSPPLNAALHITYICLADVVVISWFAFRLVQACRRHRAMLVVRPSRRRGFRMKCHAFTDTAFRYVPFWIIFARGHIQIVLRAGGAIVIRSDKKPTETHVPSDTSVVRATEDLTPAAGEPHVSEEHISGSDASSSPAEKPASTPSVLTDVPAQVPPILPDAVQAQDPVPNPQESVRTEGGPNLVVLDQLKEMRRDLQDDVNECLGCPEELLSEPSKRYVERALAVGNLYDMLIEKEGRMDGVVRKEVWRLREAGML